MRVVNFLSVLSPWIALLIFLAFIFTFFSFIKIISRKGKSNFFFTRLSFGIFSLVLGFSLLSFMSFFLLEAAGSSFKDNNLEIYVDGIILDRAQQKILIDDFSSIYTFKKSGSHPTTIRRVNIISENYNLEFDFKVDSRDSSVYWIFYPKFRFKGKIGMIKTEAFLGDL